MKITAFFLVALLLSLGHVATGQPVGLIVGSTPVIGGSAGDCLTRNAGGLLSSGACGGAATSIGVGSTAITGGTAQRLLYDAAGSLGETAGMTWVETGYLLRLLADLGGATQSRALSVEPTFQSSVTAAAAVFRAVPAMQTTTFTLNNLRYFQASQGLGFGGGAMVTSQYGFVADAGMTGAMNNYGFYSDIPSAAGRWNFYAAGTAKNVLNGPLQIGTTTELTLDVAELGIRRTLTLANTAPGALGAKFTVGCGTNAGTAKLLMYAGTSTTPVTIVDNVGSGVSGC